MGLIRDKTQPPPNWTRDGDRWDRDWQAQKDGTSPTLPAYGVDVPRPPRNPEKP